MFRDEGDVGEVDDGRVEEKAEAVEWLDRRRRKGRVDGRRAGRRRWVEKAAVMDCLG